MVTDMKSEKELKQIEKDYKNLPQDDFQRKYRLGGKTNMFLQGFIKGIRHSLK